MLFDTPEKFWDFVWMCSLSNMEMENVIQKAEDCPDNETLVAFVCQIAGRVRILSDASFEQYRSAILQCQRCSWILGKAYVLCTKKGIKPEDNVDAYITALRELFAQETTTRLTFVTGGKSHETVYR